MSRIDKIAIGMLIILLIAVLFASSSLMAAEKRIDSLQEQVEELCSQSAWISTA